MENYNLHRRAQSGWHPTSYSRKPMPDAPRERNWAALMEAAKRKPRTDNDALEAKFGESAKGRPAGFELAREGSSPSSPAIPDGARGEDLYEPVGTMPVVGDRFVYADRGNTETHKFVDVSATAFADRDWARMVQAQGELWTSESYHCSTTWYAANVKILKRQPRKQVEGRVWKAEGANADKSFLAVMMPDGSVSTYYSSCGWSRAEKRTLDIIKSGASGPIRFIELHGPEADAIIRECVSAMGLDTVAVRVDIGHGAQIDCKAARAMRGTWVRIYANGLIIPCEENDPDRIGYVR